MNNVLLLERAQLADISSVQQQSFSDLWSNHLLERQLTAPRTLNLGVYDGDQLLGYILLQYIFEQAELLQIAVLPSARGQGIGRRLIAAAAIQLAELEAEQLFLEVRQSNHTAISLYLDSGFLEQGRRKNYYTTSDAATEDALIFTLKLSKEFQNV